MQLIKPLLFLIGLNTLLSCISQTTLTNNSFLTANPNKTQLILASSKNHGDLGERYAKAHHYKEAITATRQAIFKAQEANAPAWLIRWQWQLGHIFASSGKTNQAIQALSQAVQGLVPLDKTFGWDMTECNALGDTSLYHKLRPLFSELADLLLQRAAKNPAKKQHDLQHVRNTIEQLKTADIENYFGDCVTALPKRSIAEIDAPHTAVIYPILLNERLELLIGFPQSPSLHQFIVPVKRDEVRDTVQQFRAALLTGHDEPENTHYLIYAQKLYQWLIEPLQETLKQQQIHTLVFVPEGILNMLSMAALHDGKQFLIEKYAVAITPSLNLTDLNSNPLTPEQTTVLITGLTEAAQGYPKLPYAEKEINAITKIYHRSTSLLNEQFTATNFEQALKKSNYNLVHLISHAEFAHNIKDSFIVTNDGKLKFTDKPESAIFTKNRHPPLELLTLSACNTAKGDKEWAALGLSGIAIQAGARSSLATLWKAHDKVTYHLIKDFYKHKPLKHHSKAQALQIAQQEVLNSSYHHPFYWASLVLIGNWL